MSLVVFSLKYMHISDVYSIYYVYPALVILLGFIFLGEKPGIFDYFCLVSCFIGAILIIKPSFIFDADPIHKKNSNGWLFFIVFCAAFIKSVEDVIVRNVGQHANFMVYPFLYSIIGMLLFPIPMLINDRVYPSLNFMDTFIIFLVGFFTFFISNVYGIRTAK